MTRYMDIKALRLTIQQMHAVTLLIGLLVLCGCSNNLHNNIDCNQPLNPSWVDLGQITQDIQILTSDKFAGRKTASAESVYSQQFLSQRFSEIGLIPWQQEYQHSFEYSSLFSTTTGVNMVGVIPSKNLSTRWRVVMAHYDHLGQQGSKIYHGADDNASGVSGLLAIAKQWQISGLDDVNLMIVATDAEETGLHGSYALVEQIEQTPGMEIELAMNLDMIGHPSKPRAIYVEGENNFNQFATIRQQLSQQHKLCIRLSYVQREGPNIKRMNWLNASDHYPFHKAGLPWIYFGVPPHNKYHTPQDKIDTVNIAFIATVTEIAYSFLTRTDLTTTREQSRFGKNQATFK
ncbi:M20/M25/M40 family metallo-hydrolase [Shewanella gaetbuli]|uniref:M28 family peptidase n=1 Tax=Shewanella gaetbuli TaxID=220752 RepID=A0A9X1ZXS1_9GAMM|nr:M20/M25/M40 family metallo-hydrolase [Shewanella gaetbuli]MCL1144111.1 M28 family peptidase [Shewanella gaetbuli]